MNIIICDEDGLGTDLLMNLYSEDKINEAKRRIVAVFEEVFENVFVKYLHLPLPENIQIHISENDLEECGEDAESRRLAAFDSQSTDDCLKFKIFECTVIEAMDETRLDNVKGYVTHEIVHSADLDVLNDSSDLFKELREMDEDEENDFKSIRFDELSRCMLHDLLAILDIFRAEGVALLGEHLILNKPFKSEEPENKHELFSELFKNLFKLSMLRIASEESDFYNGDFEDDVKKFYAYAQGLAYMIAPNILTGSMLRCGLISQETLDIINRCLENGECELSDEDVSVVLRSAFSMGLTEYIKGIVSDSQERPAMAPILPLLEFCGSLQINSKKNVFEMFAKEMKLHSGTHSFIVAMNRIVGKMMSEGELQKKCESTCDNTEDEKLKEKVKMLFDIMRTEEAEKNRTIARWALTYFFAEKDLIHDRIPVLGLVDDMLVLDWAFKLLKD